jgi:hypothetical protein
MTQPEQEERLKPQRSTAYHRLLGDLSFFLRLDTAAQALNAEYAESILAQATKLDPILSKQFLILVACTAGLFLYVAHIPVPATMLFGSISGLAGIPELLSLVSALLFLSLCFHLCIYFVAREIAFRVLWYRNEFAYSIPPLRPLYLTKYNIYQLLDHLISFRAGYRVAHIKYLVPLSVIGILIISVLAIPVITFLFVQIYAFILEYNSPMLPAYLSITVLILSSGESFL